MSEGRWCLLTALAPAPASPEELLNQLRDQLAPEEPPGGTGPSWAMWLWPSFIFVLCACLLIRRWRRRRNQPARGLAPLEWALQELGRLEAEPLPTAEEMDRFHARLADLVRGYLERHYHLPATRQTTPEFLVVARQTLPLSEPEQALLAELLQRCDLAKFARMVPTQDACRTALEQIRGLITALAARPLREESPAS